MCRPFLEEVKNHLKPGTMKGPNSKLPCVDELASKIKINQWNNIPIPLKEAFEEMINVFKQFKTYYFSNFNSIVKTQRVINMNQMQARTDDNQIKREALENIELCDQFREKRLTEFWELVE